MCYVVKDEGILKKKKGDFTALFILCPSFPSIRLENSLSIQYIVHRGEELEFLLQDYPYYHLRVIGKTI